MLTILVRYKNTRNEVVFPASTVEFFPQMHNDTEAGLLVIDEGAPVNSSKTRHLPFTAEDDPNVRDVFVMNEHGATVARYRL